MTISKRALKKNFGASTVTLDDADITWQKDRIVIKQAAVHDGTANTPAKHNYEVTITLDEFRQMLRAFSGRE